MTEHTDNRDFYHKYKDKDLAIDALLDYLKVLTYHLHKQGKIDLLELKELCEQQSINRLNTGPYENEDPCPINLMNYFLTEIGLEDDLIEPIDPSCILKPVDK